MEQKNFISDFKEQSNIDILRLIATAGKRKNVDCMNLSHFCPQTGDKPIYSFVRKDDVVILMLDWHGKESVHDSTLRQLTEFAQHYKKAMAEAGIQLPHISSVLVTSAEISNYKEMLPMWEKKDVIVYHNIQMEQLPYVHYSFRYHAVAKSHFIAFRQWCERQGYLPNDRYAFEDVDADYDEMEFGIDDEDDDQTFLDEYLSELQHLKRT